MKNTDKVEQNLKEIVKFHFNFDEENDVKMKILIMKM